MTYFDSDSCYKCFTYIIVFLTDLLQSFKWLVCYYLKRTFERAQHLKNEGCNDFDIRNNTQVFHAQTLAALYGQVITYFQL